MSQLQLFTLEQMFTPEEIAAFKEFEVTDATLLSDDHNALVQDFMDRCGYSHKEAIIAANRVEALD